VGRGDLCTPLTPLPAHGGSGRCPLSQQVGPGPVRGHSGRSDHRELRVGRSCKAVMVAPVVGSGVSREPPCRHTVVGGGFPGRPLPASSGYLGSSGRDDHRAYLGTYICKGLAPLPGIPGISRHIPVFSLYSPGISPGRHAAMGSPVEKIK